MERREQIPGVNPSVTSGTLRPSSLIFPKRLACFVLGLFASNSDVLELAIIHLHQQLPLPVAFTTQSVGYSEPMEDLLKRIWRRCWLPVLGMQVGGDSSSGLGNLVYCFSGFRRTPGKRIGRFLGVHDLSPGWLYLVTGDAEGISVDSRGVDESGDT